MKGSSNMWCDRCGQNVTREFVQEQECPFFECPMENRVVDTGDELHQVLGEAIAKAKT